jgi:peptidyl-prolyl cis-trans isomerase C
MTTVLDRTKATRPPIDVKRTTRAELPRAKPISVNGTVIPRGEIARETQHHPADKPIDAWMQAARALVVRELLLQEARRLAIAPDPLADDEGRRETDEEALVRQLVEREVVTPVADETTCQRIYDQQRQRFRSSDLYAVRHILVAASPDDAEARAEAKTQAEAIIATLIADPGAFADLAASYSACPSKQNGGALGQISRGQTVPEFEAALAQAPVGTIMERPIESRYGLHVIALDQKIEGAQLPFELVRDRIADWLALRARETAIRHYIAMLAGRATISGIDLEAATSSLVQ